MTRRTCGRWLALLIVSLISAATSFDAQTSGPGISLALAERLGGQGVYRIAPDGQGNYWITGSAAFNAIPVTPDAAQPTKRASQNAYLMKIRSDGSVAYASYLGGSTAEIGLGVACDSAGNVYVVGETNSPDFPITPGAYSATGNGFLTKFGPDGSSMLYSTRIPGTGGGDFQYAAVAADSSGRAYVTGWTPQHDVPTTETTSANGEVAYLRFSAGGALEYSTRIGGSGGADVPSAIAVDGAGNAYVVGYTGSSDFTTKRALKSTFPSTAGEQGFLARFTSTGLDFSTYIGGSSSDVLYGVAVSPTGVYIGGMACSKDFPGAPNPSSTAGCDGAAVVAKLQLDGSAYLASTLLNGSGYTDAVNAVAVDDNERVYLFGDTNSQDFPVTQDAQQIAPSGGGDEAFFARLSMPDAMHFRTDYATYFGGVASDFAVAADGSGGAWVGGYTNSNQYPTLSSSTNSSQGLIAHYAVTGAVAPASDDEVLYAKDGSPIVGNWQLVSDPTAAGGVRIWNPDAGAPKITTPAASPANYFELTFHAQAGVPYHLWMRMRADNDSWMNDSVWVQFSDSVTSGGAPMWQIGSTDGTMVSLERCTDCGEQGWGWADNGYGQPGQLVSFATTGTHTIRVQQREDGVSIDQVVLSTRTWINTPPGAAKNDTTIVPQGGTTPPPPPPPNKPPTVTITSPANNTTAQGPVPWLPVNASASDSDGTVAKVDFYANSTLVWTSTSAPYHFTFESMPSGNYTLTAVATDNSGATTTSAPVTVTMPPVNNNPPYFADDNDIGDVGAAGGITFANGTFTVQGSGADVWGTADALNFAWESLARDGAIVARVATVSDEANWVKAGVMIRGSLDPSSAQAFMLVSHAKGVAFQRRTSDGATSVSTSGSASTAPRWVKLVRTGTVISAYESADGTTWTMVGSDTFAIPATTSVYVGLAVSSHVRGTLSTATFDNAYVIDAVGPNQAPSVSITSPANGATFTAPSSIAIGVDAHDDIGVSTIDVYANSTHLGTLYGNDETTNYSFTWSNPPAGTYSLTAVASDGEGGTTTSSPVSITVNPAQQSDQCPSVTLSQTSFYSGGPASNWKFTVTAPTETCTWSAVIDQSWLALNGVTGPTTISGTGSGSLTLATFDNNSGAFRYGTFTIGGATYKVTQESK